MDTGNEVSRTQARKRGKKGAHTRTEDRATWSSLIDFLALFVAGLFGSVHRGLRDVFAGGRESGIVVGGLVGI